MTVVVTWVIHDATYKCDTAPPAGRVTGRRTRCSGPPTAMGSGRPGLGGESSQLGLGRQGIHTPGNPSGVLGGGHRPKVRRWWHGLEVLSPPPGSWALTPLPIWGSLESEWARLSKGTERQYAGSPLESEGRGSRATALRAHLVGGNAPLGGTVRRATGLRVVDSGGGALGHQAGRVYFDLGVNALRLPYRQFPPLPQDTWERFGSRSAGKPPL